MSFDDVLEIGRRKLREYEPLLKEKIKGTKPFDKQLSRRLSRRYEASVLAANPDIVESVIDEVLGGLVGLADSFWISQPEHDDTPSGVQDRPATQTVRHNDLTLTFTSGHDIKDNRSLLWVSCWYQV
ncbi:MAG TPA: hypothetical protein VN924_10145 [Bryobacteraceae bacterium]|nr:hypothetical protein [Bryobacteraceae bacterium]